MSKQITNYELAEMVTKLLTDKETIANNLDSPEKFAAFMQGVASAVCDACGGEVSDTPPDDWIGDAMPNGDEWLIGIHWNDSVPPDGGIWKDYDTDVTWTDEGEDADGGPDTSTGERA